MKSAIPVSKPSDTDPELDVVRSALLEKRFETARRLCKKLFPRANGSQRLTLSLLLHEISCRQGDIEAAIDILENIPGAKSDQAFTVQRLLSAAYDRKATHDQYRRSEESKSGLSPDEFLHKYRTLAKQAECRAEKLCKTPEQKAQLASFRDPKTEAVQAPPDPILNAGTGTLQGTITFPDGRPAADAGVTLGFPLQISAADPKTFLRGGLGEELLPTIHAPQNTAVTRTDANGKYCLEDVPALCHDYLAVQLDPEAFDQALYFVEHGVQVEPDVITEQNAVVQDWSSAEPLFEPSPFADTIQKEDGPWKKCTEWTMVNPFHFDFPRQAVRLELPPHITSPSAPSLLLLSSTTPEKPLLLQRVDEDLLCMTDLPACSRKVLALYTAENSTAAPETELSLSPQEDGTAILKTGRACFRLNWTEKAKERPPILSLKGEDGVWRGEGRFALPDNVGVASLVISELDSGPLEWSASFAYTFTDGRTWSLRLTAHDREAYLLGHESGDPPPGGGFELALPDFINGRGYLHWTPEQGNVHWTDLTQTDRELARLQESVAWWIPPQGFGYAMTADGLKQSDYIGVFTRRRGDWEDRAFERIAQGPGDDQRELDWPFPEMVGSTISMITAFTVKDGAPYFRYGFFEGERHWGLLISTLERNEGPHKEISQVQHKTSSPRLEQFIRWRLDEQDQVARPSLITHRDRLRNLRQRRTHPKFQTAWDQICEGNRRKSDRGLRALVDADPVLTWQLSREMLAEAPLRSRMTLLGRDYSDVYSPVGGRDITPFVEQYDLIAGTGVFTADEERQLRASMMLWGHMFIQPDLMNWKYNSRNANFEADRVDIVGAIGLAFRRNPDADAFIQHAADLMTRSLEIYCTPGSGKWYENPACYYLRAMVCRLNLMYHLWSHDLMDPNELPRLPDFIRWGILLLTPPMPHCHDIMRDGADPDEWTELEKGRLIPPIGDHARLGRRIPELYPLMAQIYRDHNPELSDLLRWAYQASGGQGGQFSSYPLFFTSMDEDLLEPVPSHHLASRRLEGFGAVLRGNFNQPDEFYLLLKQGPGGYRYHRTEGSILLFAGGKPLIYDGGEAGETWRHTTLSFHDTHMPLAPGHVERFETYPELDFVQGVHPVALKPGEPVFLSDTCEHPLVKTAYARFNEPNPANVRSVLWVKDEYVILHDDLHLPEDQLTHWHLQAVADRHTGNLEDGYVFEGRFGVDLQVVLCGLDSAKETVTQTPTLEYDRTPEATFKMRHLQLSTTSPERITALLRPLHGDRKPLEITQLGPVLRVQGDGIDDTLILSRDPVECRGEDFHFIGRYGAIIRRRHGRTSQLIDGETMKLKANSC